MREFLVDTDVRPNLEESVWVEDVYHGPDQRGIKRLQKIQEHYGFCHVTTGNASGGATGPRCGVYVRESAYYDAPNLLRTYLSKS